MFRYGMAGIGEVDEWMEMENRQGGFDEGGREIILNVRPGLVRGISFDQRQYENKTKGVMDLEVVEAVLGGLVNEINCFNIV